jgi:hypothetical protein
MTTYGTDPAKGWEKVRLYYSEFATKQGWEFLGWMVEFVEWIISQPMFVGLYPGTSREWLTVSLAPGYYEYKPFVVVLGQSDGKFSCELFAEVADCVDGRLCSLEEAPVTFSEFINRLENFGKKETMPS